MGVAGSRPAREDRANSQRQSSLRTSHNALSVEIGLVAFRFQAENGFSAFATHASFTAVIGSSGILSSSEGGGRLATRKGFEPDPSYASMPLERKQVEAGCGLTSSGTQSPPTARCESGARSRVSRGDHPGSRPGGVAPCGAVAGFLLAAGDWLGHAGQPGSTADARGAGHNGVAAHRPGSDAAICHRLYSAWWLVVFQAIGERLQARRTP